MVEPNARVHVSKNQTKKTLDLKLEINKMNNREVYILFFNFLGTFPEALRLTNNCQSDTD
jgi:hypothetical protein